MATLTADVNSTQGSWNVSALLPGVTYVQVDDEIVRILDQRSTELRFRVERGYAGTTAASHSSGATLTPVYVPSESGGEGGAGAVLSASVTLTHAQILTLPTTPVEVVPAPGAGLILSPVNMLAYFHGTDPYTNYDGTGAQLGLLQGGFSILAVPMAGLVTYEDADAVQPFNAHNAYTEGTAANDLASEFVDQPLMVYADNTLGNYTGGNVANTLKITVWYTVFEV